MRTGRPRKFTPEQVIKALQKTKGAVYLAAEELGCDHKTIDHYAERFPEVRAAIISERGKLLDVAELKLSQAILKGEPWSICFLLKTQGKHRGYVERAEVEHSGSMEIEVGEIVASNRQEAQGLLSRLSKAGRVSGRNGTL